MIKHSRFYFYCAGMYYLNNLGGLGELRIYDPLPLYHSAGGVVGIGLMTVFGATVAIRRKFSVRNFWKDCVNFKVIHIFILDFFIIINHNENFKSTKSTKSRRSQAAKYQGGQIGKKNHRFD